MVYFVPSLQCASKGLPPPCDAGVAQLVEHELPKLGVAGSNPVFRSIYFALAST